MIEKKISDKFEKVIHEQPFSGKQEDWQAWSEWILAGATRKYRGTKRFSTTRCLSLRTISPVERLYLWIRRNALPEFMS